MGCLEKRRGFGRKTMPEHNGSRSLPVTFLSSFAMASSLLRWEEGCCLAPTAKVVELAAKALTQCALMHLYLHRRDWYGVIEHKPVENIPPLSSTKPKLRF